MESRKAPKVIAVIVNYCSEEACLDCISSLAALSYSPEHLIVIDNKSPEDSLRRLKKLHSENKIELVLNVENRGYAAAVNIGAKLALLQGADLVWLLNPDTLFDRDALSELVSAASRNTQAAAFGGKVLYKDRTSPTGRPIIWSAGGVVTPSERRVEMSRHGEEDSNKLENERIVDYLPGCSLLIRADAFRVIGFFSEDYFLYFEETDWCLRARLAGRSLLYVPASVTYHDFDDRKMQGPQRVYYYNRSRRLFWYRWAVPHLKWRTVAETLFKELPAAQKGLMFSRDAASRSLFKAHRLSCLDFLRGRIGKR